MKKIYLISSLLIILGILGGISFFLIRDASARIPDNSALTTQNNVNYRFGDDHKKLKTLQCIIDLFDLPIGLFIVSSKGVSQIQAPHPRAHVVNI